MMSIGLATNEEGLKLRLDPPTRTLWTRCSAALGVGSGVPGHELYVVVQTLEPRVTTSVTILGEADGVRVLDPEGDGFVEFETVALAEASKFAKEFAVPSAPQLIAKTIPSPQWEVGVPKPP